MVEGQDQYGNWNALYVPCQPPGQSKNANVTSSDPLYAGPTTITFTCDDKARKTITVTLNTIGTQTITVREVANPSIFGTITIDVTGRSTPAPSPSKRVIRRAAPAAVHADLATQQTPVSSNQRNVDRLTTNAETSAPAQRSAPPAILADASILFDLLDDDDGLGSF
jgi:hypothetical protein